MGAPDRATIERFVDEAFNRGNLDVIDEVYAEQFVTHDPGTPGADQGRDDAKQFIGMYRAAFPDGRSTVEDVVVQGDLLAYRWSYRGTHSGDLMGIPPTGREVAFWGLSLVRFRDGKIVEQWNAWDMLGVLQQVGAAPVPAQA